MLSVDDKISRTRIDIATRREFFRKSTRIIQFSLLTLILLSLPSYSSLFGLFPSDSTLSNASLPDALAASPVNDTASTPVVSEPLVAATGSMTRSFSSPLLQFLGDTQVNLTQTITWYQNGTTSLTDNFGDVLSVGIPGSDGQFSLLQNSTTVDQKVTGQNVNYDIYWKPVKNVNGFIDKYKFVIAGTSSNGYDIKLHVDSTEKFDYNGTRLLAAKSVLSNSDKISSSSNSTQGLGLDWSDATSAGYQMSFDSTSKSLDLSVGKSFYVDPTTIATISLAISPPSTDYYEDERRYYNAGGGVIFAFYYDGSNIMYKNSIDNGKTWSGTAANTGSGVISGDASRWTLVGTTISNTNYVNLIYFAATAGPSVTYYALHGTISGNSIVWASPSFIWSVSGTSNSFGAAVAATDSNTNIFAALRGLSGSSYLYTVAKSTDGGSTWSISLSPVSSGSPQRIEMALTHLGSSSMLFAYVTYAGAEIQYYVYDGTSWGTQQTTSGAGMGTSTVKQISAVSNPIGHAYLAYLVGGNSGPLKIAEWFTSGLFDRFQLADNSLSHSLPSVTFTNDDNINYGTLHIYTLAGNKIYETRYSESPPAWGTPSHPFGTSFNSPNELTSAVGNTAGLWIEGTTAPYNLQFGVNPSPTPVKVLVDTSNYRISPGNTDYYEGEKRIVPAGATIFAFYYDGSNIKYKTSVDNGVTWSSSTNTGTGVVASDYFRWTVTSVTLSNVYNINLLYYVVSGSNYNFYAKHGTFDPNGPTITWSAPYLISTVSGTNLAAAAVGASDTNNNIFAAFRYISGGAFNYAIYESTNGGASWTTSLAATTTSSCCRIEMTLSPLASGQMLFAYTTYEGTDFSYRVFNGSSWGIVQTTSGAGMTASTFKQISSASDSSSQPFIAYVTGGSSGTLKVARWTNAGTFSTFETADSVRSHSLPSIAITRDNIIHLYTLSGGLVYETDNISGGWNAPTKPFGSSFSSPDDLTAGIYFSSALWVEGTNIYAGTTPFTHTYAGGHDNQAGPIKLLQVFGYNDFSSSDPLGMTSDLLSVISSAGFSSSTNDVTGIQYQGIVRLAPDNTVESDPQVWSPTYGNLWGCFINNECPTLDSGTSLNNAYQTFYWNGNNVVFFVEATDNSGSVYDSSQTYTRNSSIDPSNYFTDGVLYKPSINGNRTYKFLQFGMESDGDTLNWVAHQYGMGYDPSTGGTINLANLNVFEQTANYDSSTDSSLTYIYDTNGQPIPISIGYNAGSLQGNYHHIGSGVPSGDVYWWRGQPIITPGSQLWP